MTRHKANIVDAIAERMNRLQTVVPRPSNHQGPEGLSPSMGMQIKRAVATASTVFGASLESAGSHTGCMQTFPDDSPSFVGVHSDAMSDADGSIVDHEAENKFSEPETFSFVPPKVFLPTLGENVQRNTAHQAANASSKMSEKGSRRLRDMATKIVNMLSPGRQINGIKDYYKQLKLCYGPSMGGDEFSFLDLPGIPLSAWGLTARAAGMADTFNGAAIHVLPRKPIGYVA